MKTIFFDVDGTLYDGYLVTDFNVFMATEGYANKILINEEKQLLADCKTGEIDYREAARRVLQLHADTVKGRTVKEVRKIQMAFAQKHNKLFSWVMPLMDELKRREVDVHLISASSTIVLEVIAQLLGVKSYHGTELEIIDDRYTGKLQTVLNYEAKHARIQALLGTHPNDLHIGVGDSLGDVDMLRAMDVGIIYNPQTDDLLHLAQKHGWAVGREETMKQVVLTAVNAPKPPTIDRLAELQQFVADFSRITRVPLLGDTGRLENDVDHSYALALTCWYLAPKIAPELHLEKIFKYALSHDIVELYAGDTFVFADQAAIDSKAKREDAALEQLYNDWPDFTDIVDHAKGYKEKVDEEAKFVKAVDKILPLLVIELGESSEFWNRHKITLDMERKNKVTIHVSEYVSPYYERTMLWLEGRGNMHQT